MLFRLILPDESTIDLGRVSPYSETHRWSRAAAKSMVIDLAVHHEFSWDYEDNQTALLRSFRRARVRSLVFLHGRYERGHKVADPDHDGLMGWITEHREVSIGSLWAKPIAAVGLPRVLRHFAFADAGLDDDAVPLIVSALPRKLETLDLSLNKLGSRGITALCEAELPLLRELRVGWPGHKLAALRKRFGERLVAVPV